MKKIILLLTIVFAFAAILSGCCNSKYVWKQFGEDLHTYFAHGDPEALSEVEPDSAI